MKGGLSTFGLVILLLTSAFSQQKLGKDEILEEYRKTQSTPSLDSIFRWDSQSSTRKVLDELLMNKVDTLVIYSVDFPGLGSLGKNDSCETSRNTRNSYFFWRKKGKYFFESIDGRCRSRHADANGKVIKFGTDHFTQIKDEFFMEAVSGATKTGNSLVTSESWVDHEPKYTILVIVHGQYNYLTFTENGLTNKTSLFLDYNKGLTSFKLFELLKKETGTE